MRGSAGAWWSGLALLGFVICAGFAHLAISSDGNGLLQWGAAAASGLPHAAANGLLLAWFASTLRPGSEPLVTRVARCVHGTLKPEIESYTRSVTIAWCVFFTAQLVVSLVLFLLAPLETWSLFVNVLNAPLVVLMFAGEYLVRIVRHPDHPRASIASTLKAIAKQDSLYKAP